MNRWQKFVRAPLLLTLPAYALAFLVFGLPIFLLLMASLNAPEWSLSNYAVFLNQNANIRVLRQTIEVSLTTTAICALIGYPAAYVINAASGPWKRALIAMVVIPYLTSLLVRTYAWIVILGDRGLINNILRDLGLISFPLELIYNRRAIYIGMVHIMLPMMILPVLSVMAGIDRRHVTAARSMGAGPLSAFWRVFFPLSLPGLRSGCLLVFILCLGFYITPAALGGLRETMLSNFIAAQVESAFNLGRTAAAAFVLLALAVVFILIFGLDLSGAGQKRDATPVAGGLRRFLPSPDALTRLAGEWLAPLRARRWQANLYRRARGAGLGRILGVTFCTLVIAYLLFPGIVVVVMSFSAGAFLQFPPPGLSLQWYRSFFSDASWTNATMLSIRIGLMVALLSTLVGTLAAYGLNRTRTAMKPILMVILLSPIIFPVIVVGIATYLGLVEVGLVGTELGLVLAHSIGGVSFVVVIVSASMANFDTRLEQAAMSMRASPLRTFRRVTLPLIRPGILGGAAFAFLHSFDEVVISSLVSGLSLRTLPLKMWENIRHQIEPTIAAIASLLILLPVIWLIGVYVLWRRSKARTEAAARAPAGQDA